jgi:hypothetical protein
MPSFHNAVAENSAKTPLKTGGVFPLVVIKVSVPAKSRFQTSK